MNKQEWLNWRKIGSSDAPAIMQVSPWKTRYQLWEEKVFGAKEKDNAAMKRGRDMEESARRCFEEKMGVVVFPKTVVHNSLTFMTATLDGIDMDNKVMVEIKCPNKEDHVAASEKKIPEKYYPQLQHQMEVAGLDHMYYFSFDGSEGIIVEVEKEKKYIENLVKEEKDFWECVIQNKPPVLSDRDYILQGEEWEDIAEKKYSLSQQIKALEKEEDALMKQLISLSKTQNAIGEKYKLSKIIEKGRIDYSSIPVLKDIDLDLYRKNPITKWILRSI